MKGFKISMAVLLAVLPASAPAPADPTLEWVDLYDGGAATYDVATAALADAEGHLVVGGESYDLEAGADMFVRKLHRDTREELWSLRWSSHDGNDIALSAMAFDGSGDVIVAGFIRGCEG